MKEQDIKMAKRFLSLINLAKVMKRNFVLFCFVCLFVGLCLAYFTSYSHLMFKLSGLPVQDSKLIGFVSC